MTDREKKMFNIINDLYDDYKILVEKIMHTRNEFDYQTAQCDCMKLADYKIDIMEFIMEFKDEL